jgi:hypothetical protein
MSPTEPVAEVTGRSLSHGLRPSGKPPPKILGLDTARAFRDAPWQSISGWRDGHMTARRTRWAS